MPLQGWSNDGEWPRAGWAEEAGTAGTAIRHGCRAKGTEKGRCPQFKENISRKVSRVQYLYYLPVWKTGVEVKVLPWDWVCDIYILYICVLFYTLLIYALLIFRGLLPTATPFLPRDASRRFQSRSGYLTRKHPNKQPMFPHTLSLVVYGVISSWTQAINFLTICHRFYEPVPPNAQSAQVSLRGAPNWGQQLCRAMGITYPGTGSTRHLTANWKT